MTEERMQHMADLADEYGLDVGYIISLSEVLGPEEDHDGLVAMVQEFADMY
jgi:hypothetical protein